MSPALYCFSANIEMVKNAGSLVRVDAAGTLGDRLPAIF
jgi:hypothetical protein